MALTSLTSLDLVVNRSVTIVTVTGTATSRVTLGSIEPSERTITTNPVVNKVHRTSSYYLIDTQGGVAPGETVVRASSNVGVAQKFTTPELTRTITTTSTVYNYGNVLPAVTDNNFQLSPVRVNNTTNFFGNNRSYRGAYFDTVTPVVIPNSLDISSVTAPTSSIFRNRQNYEYGSIVSNVAGIGFQAYTTPGTYTFTVPAGVTSLSIVGVGGGGGGAQNTTSPSGGGGGMVKYTNNIAVTPGETLTVVIGAGGTPGTVLGNIGESTYTYKNSNMALLVNALGGAGGNGMYWAESETSVKILDTPSSAAFYTFRAVSQLNQTITYSASGLPNGVAVDAVTGILGGDPDTVANTTAYTFTVTATTAAQSISRQFTLIVGSITQAVGTISNPAPSISALRADGITIDGAYWFSTTKQPTPFQAYVRFNYIDGGDWALLLKVHNQGDMPSGSPFWTNTTVNNATDWNLTSGAWSKYETWNGIPFTRLMMVMTQGGVAKVPPIMVFNVSRTFAEAIAVAGGSGAALTQNNIVKANRTEPVRGNSISYWNMPMAAGSPFTDVGGAEDIMQAYGIGMWANNASNATTAEGFASTGRAGAWIGCPLDEGAHTFNNDSNTGADSAFGFGFAAGNPAKTGSAGYAEWTNATSTNTLPGYVWVR